MNGEKKGNCWGFLQSERKFTMNTIHTIGNRLSSTIRRAFSTIFPAIFLKFFLVCASGAVQSCWNSAKTRRFHDVHTLLDVFSSHDRWAVVALSAMLTLCGGGEACEAWWKVESVNERRNARNEKQKIMNNYTSNSPVCGMGAAVAATLWCARCERKISENHFELIAQHTEWDWNDESS